MILSNGSIAQIFVDDVIVREQPAVSFEQISIRGGSNDGGPEARVFYDNLLWDDWVNVTLKPQMQGMMTISFQEGFAYGWARVNTSTRPEPRQGHSAAVLPDGQMYIFGGERSSFKYSDLWAYNFSAANWSFVQTNIGPSGRYDHSAAVYGRKMYIFGGRGSAVMNDFWAFDIDSGLWAPVPSNTSAPSPRFGHTATIIGGKMYVFGGYGLESGASSELWTFDFERYHWTLLGPRTDLFVSGSQALLESISELIVFPAKIPPARFAHVAIAKDSRLIISGGTAGVGNSPVQDDMWVFDPASKTWTDTGPVGGIQRFDSGAIALESTGEAILFGGVTPEGVSGDVFTYFIE